MCPRFTDSRLVMRSAEHRLTDRASVTVRGLAREHLLQDPDALPEWRGVALELRDGPRPEVPATHQVEQKLELVASGPEPAYSPCPPPPSKPAPT